MTSVLKWRVFILVFTAWLLSGCITMPQEIGLASGIGKGGAQKYSRDVFIRPVKLNAAELGANLATAETAMTLSVRNFIAETGTFRNVHLPPIRPGAVGDQLQFEFERVTVARRAHPAYFPAALLTLTLYIWGNGAIYVDTTDIRVKLVAFSADGKPLAEFVEELRQSRNVGFWDPEYFLPSGIAERTRVVEKLLGRYTQYLSSTNHDGS